MGSRVIPSSVGELAWSFARRARTTARARGTALRFQGVRLLEKRYCGGALFKESDPLNPQERQQVQIPRLAPLARDDTRSLARDDSGLAALARDDVARARDDGGAATGLV